MPKLRILSNLARTGGTLVSRCIGCMDGIVLLSEIHPFGHQVHESFNILNQAIRRHGLRQPLTENDAQSTFSEVTQTIAREAESKGLQLVIRDWAHLDFMAVPFLDQPCYRSRLVETLDKDFEITQVHLVRHPVPQWLSTERLAIVRGKLSLEQFLEGHYRYAKACGTNSVVRYEDFCDDPEHQLRQIAETLNVNFDADFMNKWHDYAKLTGDTKSLKQAGTTRQIEPAPLPSVDSTLYERLQACEYYQKTLVLLGYQDVAVK